MATQLFLVPQVFDQNGKLVPEYTSTDLAGKSYVAMPFGLELITLVATDPNPALAAEPDVYAFPTDLSQVLANADVLALSSWLVNYNIPLSQIVAGMTFATAARSLAQLCQVLQRNLGLTGNAVFSGQTMAAIQQQSAAIKAGTQPAGSVAAPAVKVGVVQPTLVATPSASLQDSLSIVANSFSFDAPDMSSDVETALLSLSQQWTAPLHLNRGDGFTL